MTASESQILARPRTPLATAALVVALVIPVSAIGFRVGSASLLASRDFGLVGILAVVEAAVVLLLAIAAAVLGVIVLARRGHGRARAGAAIAIASLSLWGILMGLLNGALLEVFTN